MSGEGASPSKPWWQEEGAIALALIFLLPVGVFLMWSYAPWKRGIKWAVTAGAALAMIMTVVGVVRPEGESNVPVSFTYPTSSAQESAPRSDFGFNYRVGYKTCGWDREETFSEAGTRNPEAAAKYYAAILTSDAAPGGYAGCLAGLKGIPSRY